LEVKDAHRLGQAKEGGHPLGRLFILVGYGDLGSRPGDPDHLVDGGLLVAEKVDPADVKRGVSTFSVSNPLAIFSFSSAMAILVPGLATRTISSMAACLSLKKLIPPT
jgi:hypothetical protein